MMFDNNFGKCGLILACPGGAIGSIGYGDRRVWVQGPGWPDHCVRL